MDNLKIYEIIIGSEQDELGVNFVSFVDKPAVQVDFLKFNEDKCKQTFSIDNEEEQIVLGVIMLADTPIFRSNKDLGDHYIVFSKDTIKRIVMKYFKEEKTSSVNLDHKFIVEEGVYLFQSYIVDRELGINPPLAFADVPDGSWIGAYKVDNKIVWSGIKSGLFNGFSIEGIFGYGDEVMRDAELEQEFREIHKLLAQIR
jgi:hypothetical protein